ncbi:MAG: hypothetical protein PWQ28_675, partial [Candidatus Woesearchaeota archaeon]|nr:hypothetical protein [Candidatus Woesearchaeota archaeon]
MKYHLRISLILFVFIVLTPSSIATELQSIEAITPASTYLNIANNLYVSSSNVGIGTTSPSYKLHVNGNFYANTVNTGIGNTEVYLMNQNVRTTDAVTFSTVNTGQGANELYAMNQNVRTTDSPTFTRLTLSQGTGTAPLSVSSTTLVTNLNADLLDGISSSGFWQNTGSWQGSHTDKTRVSGTSYGSGEVWLGYAGGKGYVIVDGEFYANEGNALVWNQLNDGSGSGLDADLLDGFDSGNFLGGLGASHSASNLPVGWYTIATNTGDRASARFAIRDTASGKHQSVVFYAAHHFGTDSSNTITVLDNSYYSGNPFRYIRIKDYGTYDGAALQVYIDDASNSVTVYLLGDNFQSSGWVLKDWIPDSTDPGDVSNWASFGERAKVDLNNIAQGGMATTGEIYAGGDTTQYKVWHQNNDGPGSGLNADLLDGHDSSYFQTALTNPVTGTGTANYLTKWTGTTSLGNSVIYESGGNVGIGTTDPGARKLKVAGDAEVTGNWYWLPSKNFQLYGSANNQEWSFDLRNQGSYTGNYWQVWSDKNSRSILAVRGDTENVGIGTTSPAQKLHVAGNTYVTGYLGVGSSNPVKALDVRGDAYISGNVGIRDTSPSHPLTIAASSTADQAVFQKWRYSPASDTYYLELKQTVTSGVVRYTYDLYNNGVDYPNMLTFDRGNVGIGTTAPAGKLEIAENGVLTATDGNLVIQH